MYNGFTASTEQDRARWELMQKRAEQAAKQGQSDRQAVKK